ncbi:MAG: hypothetical protein ACI9VS_000588 [Candidatus Binatia bacterium]
MISWREHCHDIANRLKDAFTMNRPTLKLHKKSALGLQLHSNKRPQEHRFCGLVLSENPEDKLLTLQTN